jgi:hypothetical protein
LHDAARFLGLSIEPVDSLSGFWQAAVPAWARLLSLREAAAANRPA